MFTVITPSVPMNTYPVTTNIDEEATATTMSNQSRIMADKSSMYILSAIFALLLYGCSKSSFVLAILSGYHLQGSYICNPSFVLLDEACHDHTFLQVQET